MKTFIQKNRIAVHLLLAAAMVISGVTLALLFRHGRAWVVPAVILAETWAFLLFLFAMLVLQTVRSARKGLYSYGNVELLGGAIYTLAQLIALTILGINGIFHPERLTLAGIIDSVTDFPRLFSLFAVPFMAVVSLLVVISNLALIRHEGFRIGNLWGVILGVLYIGGTWVLYLLYDIVSPLIDAIEGPAALVLPVVNGYFCTFVLLMLSYFESIFVGFLLASWSAVKHHPSRDRDYAVILGCAVRKDGTLTPLLRERTDRALRFAEEQQKENGKQLRFVPSGGRGADEPVSEGAAMKNYLVSQGVPEERILPEEKSTDTKENMEFSRALIEQLQPDAKVVFSTTNYHIYRSGIFAGESGLKAEGIAARTKWYFWPNGIIREFFGLVAVNRRAHCIVALLTAGACVTMALLSLFLGTL